MRSHLKLMHHVEVNIAKQEAAKDEQKVGKTNHFFRTEKYFFAVALSELVAID